MRQDRIAQTDKVMKAILGASDMQVLSGSVYSVGRNDALYAQDVITANFIVYPTNFGGDARRG